MEQVSHDLAALGAPLVRLLGDPPALVAALARDLQSFAVVTDFDPLRHKRLWLSRAAAALTAPLYEVDARNVVPCFVASQKAEYMARTLRPKIHRLLPEFLDDFPAPAPLDQRFTGWPPSADLTSVRSALGLEGVLAPSGCTPGEAAGLAALADFIAQRLHGYATARNSPVVNGQSNLSAWLHFGMLSAQRVALSVASAAAPQEDIQAFLEELIVRRELADNFCLYTPEYDSPKGFPAWARASLAAHEADPRPALYDMAAFEAGATHDPAWNAAQLQMVHTGKMHGYMRMYWGKKILEWSPSAGAALHVANTLNDRWQLDGRDPNGYAGTAWCIGGVHDRPWAARPVFGQVRSMTLAGLGRKFNVAAYVRAVEELTR